MKTPFEASSNSTEAASASASSELLLRARAGDETALDRLFRRYMPQLWRWAHGRIPGWARNSSDTSDIIQDTLLQTLRNLHHFEPHQKGALLRYLRRSLVNRIRDHTRNIARHPWDGLIDEAFVSNGASPLDVTLVRIERERYLAALARLRPADRLAVSSRIDHGASYEEIQAALSLPSAQAARQAVRRAVLRLAAEMRRG